MRRIKSAGEHLGLHIFTVDFSTCSYELKRISIQLLPELGGGLPQHPAAINSSRPAAATGIIFTDTVLQTINRSLYRRTVL